MKSNEMEFIDEISTQITEIKLGFNTFKNLKDGEYKFTEEAQDFYNEIYDEIESLYIKLIKNKLKTNTL